MNISAEGSSLKLVMVWDRVKSPGQPTKPSATEGPGRGHRVATNSSDSTVDSPVTRRKGDGSPASGSRYRMIPGLGPAQVKSILGERWAAAPGSQTFISSLFKDDVTERGKGNFRFTQARQERLDYSAIIQPSHRFQQLHRHPTQPDAPPFKSLRHRDRRYRRYNRCQLPDCRSREFLPVSVKSGDDNTTSARKSAQSSTCDSSHAQEGQG